MQKIQSVMLVLVLLLGACAPEPQTAPASGFTTLPPLATPSPAQTLPPADTNTPLTPSANTIPAPEDCDDCLIPNTPAQYDIRAELDWATHTMIATQHVHYHNDADRRLDDIVFNIETHREPGYFALTDVKLATVTTQNYTLDGARLTIPLDTPLARGCSIDLTLDYTLTIPPIGNDYYFGHLGYWGYSARQLNLALWLPLVAWYDPAWGWRSPDYHNVGEYFVLRTSDFALELTVNNAPETLKVAGPGTVTHEENRWYFDFPCGREIALSLSPEFKTLTTTTASGVEIDLFHLAPAGADTLDTARHALNVAVDAVTLFEELYGPYPHTRLVVVEGDFPDGMEFSGLVFVGEAWFRTWKNIPNDWLTMITAHEVAHQWWYNLVGNDHGRYPYLDEALAIYSEALFFERYYPDHLQWWWDFRIHTYAPTGYVDMTVYDFQEARPYINAVYLRGALLMAALRADLGDDVFFAWLQEYANTMIGQIASPLDFWGTLPEDAYMLTQATRAAYMHTPDILTQADMIP